MGLSNRFDRVFASLLIAASILSAAVASAEPLNIGYQQGFGASPLFVIDQRNWPGRVNLELHLKSFPNAVALADAVASGVVDLGYGEILPLLDQAGRAKNLIILAASAIEETALVGQGKILRHLDHEANTQAAIKRFTVKENRPARLGFVDDQSLGAIYAHYWLENFAMVPPGELTLMAKPNAKDLVQALADEEIDLAFMTEPSITRSLVYTHPVSIVAYGGEIFLGQPGTVVYARQDWAMAHSHAVNAWRDLQNQAIKLLLTQPQEAAESVRVYIPVENDEKGLINQILRSPTSKFIADREALRVPSTRLVDYLIKTGRIATRPDLAPLWRDLPPE